jgi:hypothetical protein
MTDNRSALPRFKPGFYGQGRTVAKAAVEQWAGVSPFQGDKWKAAMDASHVAQAELAEVGQQIAQELGDLGVALINPGVKKDGWRVIERFVQRDHNAALLTDLARAAFPIKEPADAEPVIERLARRFGVVDEGWLQTPVGYADKTLYLWFANGLIGEVLIVNPEMYKANSGEGHRMYVDMRTWGVTEKEKAAKTASLKYATFALCPSVYDDEHHRGWVKFDQEWQEINYADIWFKAKVASKAEFDQMFPQLSMPA